MNDGVYRVLETRICKATNNSSSLRTTVPQPLVRAIGLHEGDVLIWKIFRDGRIVVEKLQQ